MDINSDQNFQFAFNYTLVDEGGYSNDIGDSGGPTKYGITQYDYSVFKGHSASADDVKAMTLDEAKQIYYTKYWITQSCDKITSKAISCCIFNMGVNFGIGIGQKFAQACVGTTQDGHIGPITLAAISITKDSVFVPKYVDLCKARYKSLLWKPSNWKFYNGWMNRANRLMSLLNI